MPEGNAGVFISFPHSPLMSDPNSPRVEIFLDGSNFYNGLRLQFGDGRYNVEKLVARILAGRPLTTLNFYTATIDPGRDQKGAASQQRFLTMLRALSFPVRICTSPLRYLPGWPSVPPQEKGIDALMVQDLILGAVDRRFDVAVILTGDRDFMHVVQLLHGRFKIPLETYFPASRSHLFDHNRSCFARAEVITKTFYDAIR